MANDEGSFQYKMMDLISYFFFLFFWNTHTEVSKRLMGMPMGRPKKMFLICCTTHAHNQWSKMISDPIVLMCWHRFMSQFTQIFFNGTVFLFVDQLTWFYSNLSRMIIITAYILVYVQSFCLVRVYEIVTKKRTNLRF